MITPQPETGPVETFITNTMFMWFHVLMLLHFRTIMNTLFVLLVVIGIVWLNCPSTVTKQEEEEKSNTYKRDYFSFPCKIHVHVHKEKKHDNTLVAQNKDKEDCSL